MEASKIDGKCLCGSVRISLSEPKAHVEICHCDMCRRWTGSTYPALEGTEFAIEGNDSIGRYQSSEWAERAFCKTCGSNLWYKFLPTGNRSFLAGLFDHGSDLPVGREIFIDEKARWTDLSGDHARLTGQEVIADAEAQGFSFD